MGVRESSRAYREARVLAAARQLFDAKGFENTSVREIAELAGVSVGTVANAGDKAALLGRLVDDFETTALLGRIAALGPVCEGRSFADEVAEVFGAWFRTHDDAEPLVRGYVATVLGAPDRRTDLDRQVVDAVGRRLAQHRPGLDPQAVRDLSFAVFATVCLMVGTVLTGSQTADEALAATGRIVGRVTDPGVATGTIADPSGIMGA